MGMSGRPSPRNGAEDRKRLQVPRNTIEKLAPVISAQIANEVRTMRYAASFAPMSNNPDGSGIGFPKKSVRPELMPNWVRFNATFFSGEVD